VYVSSMRFLVGDLFLQGFSELFFDRISIGAFPQRFDGFVMRFCWDFYSKNLMSFVMGFFVEILHVGVWTFILKMRIDVAFMDDSFGW